MESSKERGGGATCHRQGNAMVSVPKAMLKVLGLKQTSAGHRGRLLVPLSSSVAGRW